MAKDDYYVIVYKILSYLYKCLKSGERPNLEYLNNDNYDFNINKQYWDYIFYNLYNEKYINGIKVIRVIGGENPQIYIKFNITPFLFEPEIKQGLVGVVLGESADQTEEPKGNDFRDVN